MLGAGQDGSLGPFKFPVLGNKQKASECGLFKVWLCDSLCVLQFSRGFPDLAFQRGKQKLNGCKMLGCQTWLGTTPLKTAISSYFPPWPRSRLQLFSDDWILTPVLDERRTSSLSVMSETSLEWLVPGYVPLCVSVHRSSLLLPTSFFVLWWYLLLN